jgi:hypothetical protein
MDTEGKQGTGGTETTATGAPPPAAPPETAKAGSGNAPGTTNAHTEATGTSTATVDATGAGKTVIVSVLDPDEEIELLNGGKVVMSAEVLKERLQKATANARAQVEARFNREKEEAAAQAAQEEKRRQEASLQEQQQFKELAEGRGATILEHEGVIAGLRREVEDLKPYKDLAGEFIRREYAGLPAPIVDLLKERPLTEQLDWLKRNKDQVVATAPAPNGTPPASTNGTTTPTPNGTENTGNATAARQTQAIPTTPQADGNGQGLSPAEMERGRKKYQRGVLGGW